MVADPGWRRIGPDPAILNWANAARPVAVSELGRDDDLRCGGTWVVGLDLLPNAPDGSIGGCAFPWAAVGLVPEPLHRAQVSVIRSGYPLRDEGESPAAIAFRRNRDAAHLDGLLAIGAEKSRMIKEPHAWILGLPLGEVTASPLVVWEGSHQIMRRALLAALAPHPSETWDQIDVTEAYKVARAEVFRMCPRRELPVLAGEATLLHRLTIHGVAPWQGADANDRMIAYFRPLLPSVADWLARD